ncbi:hypothetical protein EIP91_004645 [Steccherinum ochraceum]|uniref:Uncharacterized protein n=1 Tax=Steccherinum ochraceum TaxID=92696 RepID=A0A4R0RUC9_9APHY|nr:hypothetical protein EIP91_004645 [Steccherinum ochraceum]
MHRRPFAGNKQRPLSAIFIGSLDSTSTPPDLPVLPEPPSPSGSSNRSGLPSPPATNSTGSGSVGEDLDTATEGSLRRKSSSLVYPRPDMPHGAHERTGGIRRMSFNEDEDDIYENDEEHTARLSLDNQRSPKLVPGDNISAIKRAANLAERNRAVINRLSALSRTGSPVPSKSKSPFTTPNAPSPAASSSTKPRAPSRASQPLSNLQTEVHYSGSETERDARNGYGHTYSSSDSMSATPTSTYSEIRPSDYVRPRQLSAPDSPAKAMQSASRSNRQKDRDRSRGSSPGPSRTPRKRVSVAMTPSDYRYLDESDNEQEDVAMAALAAIASSRRSPADGSGGKKRPTLPREFREKDRRSLDGRPDPPSTPRRNREREREREREQRSPSPVRSPRSSVAFLADPTSPRRPGAARYSTVRDLTRKHQTRWMSEDLSAPLDDGDAAGRTNGSGRRQGHRAGSSDSPLTTGNGRTLLSEGLRAAGLTKRKEAGEDVFANASAAQATVPRRTRSTGAGSILHGSEVDSPTQGAAPGRVNEGVGPPSRSADPRTPAYPQRSDRSVTYSGGARPGTSMAALHSDPPLRSSASGLRTYRSTYGLDRDGGMQDDLARQDRAYSSPFAPVRSTPAPPPISAMGGSHDAHAEHRRLMMESLSMFESQLSRLPPMGQTTTTTVPEVFQNTQHLVHMMDKLNIMLKASTNKALEAQIDHEVSDFAGMTTAEVIATIGMEHRDNLRLSDEVVRTMTAFLLSVGKLLRDTTTAREQQHLRTVSLPEEEVARRSTPETSTLSIDRRSSDGRRSRETRHSWEHGQGVQRMTSLERNPNGRGGSTNMSRTTSSSDHSYDGGVEGTPQTVRNVTTNLASSSSSRRPYTPRENHRLSSQSVSLSQSQLAALEQESPGGYEPSPTPASRQLGGRLEHGRALPQLSIPPSLSTLPSESLLRRSTNSATSASTTSTDKSANRRKVSASSIHTIRAEPSTPLMPITKGGSATTAVTTHTVSNSPDDGPIGLQRSESTSSVRTNGVTFSRPSTISVSTLSGLQQQRAEHSSLARIRTASGSADVGDPMNIRSPMSGSETERPRTVAVRGRTSLEGRGSTPESNGRGSQASTLVQSRRERRRTITEIFS